jgi:hypothetical protein
MCPKGNHHSVLSLMCFMIIVMNDIVANDIYNMDINMTTDKNNVSILIA